MPREVDPLVYNMSIENSGDVSYAEIGGLSEQIRELREVSWHFTVEFVFLFLLLLLQLTDVVEVASFTLQTGLDLPK